MAITRRGHLIPRRFGVGALPQYDPMRLMADLMRWEPFGGREALERVAGQFVPDFDIKETADAYVIHGDVPGIAEENIDVSVTGHTVTISGKREEETKKEEETYYCYERSYGEFSRSFTLPEGADTEKMQADLSSGVLTLTVPRTDATKTKHIELKKPTH